MAADTIWRENISKLKAYFKEYGNFNVPYPWKKDRQFSLWVQNIRKYPGRLPMEELRALERIGFDFNHTANWDEMFFQLEEFYAQYGHSYVPSNQKKYERLFDWTVNMRSAKPRLAKRQIKKLDSVEFDWTMSMRDRDIQWEIMYHELIKYRKKHGHVKVPQDFKENKALGDWVSRQRRYKTTKILSNEKIRKLNAIGFLWKEDILRMREEAWNGRYNELVAYKRKHGSVDRLEVLKANYQLGLWVETQINAQEKMSSARKKKLNAIGFRWDKGDIYEERWNNMYQKLKAYKKKFGHCRVKKHEDFKLSVWLQRNKRDHQKIDSDKKKQLEQLGVKWPHQWQKEIWQFMYDQLKEFKRKQGHINVSRSEAKLYEWIQTQKRLKPEKRLSPERERQLKRLGFKWKGEFEKEKRALWESMFKKFKALKEKYGTKYILKLKEFPDLSEWARLQVHSKEKLSSYKRDRLNAINFKWNPGRSYWDAHWNKMYEQLKAFKIKFGHCDVPQKFPENQTLAGWVNGQRTKKLSGEQRRMLNELGFSWANEIKQKRWMQRLNEYRDLRKKNLPVPLYTSLYSWLYQQRKNFKKLPKEKRKMLVQAGIVK